MQSTWEPQSGPAWLNSIARACPNNERPEKLCRKLCRNASKLTDSFDKVCDKDAMGRFWDKL
jgi:hypothetical protein